MGDLIEEIWQQLRDAGMAEVMLFMADGSAARCHWKNTEMLGSTRVALLGDQERNIVRIVPLSACVGIGIASPKGTDSTAFRGVIQDRLGAVHA